MYRLRNFFVIYEHNGMQVSDHVMAYDGYDVKTIIMRRTLGRANIISIERAS